MIHICVISMVHRVHKKKILAQRRMQNLERPPSVSTTWPGTGHQFITMPWMEKKKWEKKGQNNDILMQCYFDVCGQKWQMEHNGHVIFHQWKLAGGL